MTARDYSIVKGWEEYPSRREIYAQVNLIAFSQQDQEEYGAMPFAAVKVWNMGDNGHKLKQVSHIRGQMGKIIALRTS